MDYIAIGKIVDTHGIKGELRILSDFEYKSRIFKSGISFYLGKEKKKEIVATYRPHKEYDMVTFVGYNNINQVLHYKKEIVYVAREDLHLTKDEYLKQDFIGLSVFKDGKKCGRVLEIEKVSKTNEVIRAIIDDKKVLIPYHKDFIKRLDLDKREIEFCLIEGM